jgi:hypothetical protein
MYAWWAFIPSIFIEGIVGEANRQSNSQGMLERALVDDNFYDGLVARGPIKCAFTPSRAAAYGPV